MKLDLGCGQNKREGFTGVDIWEGADVVCDLFQTPWPFEDDSVDEIWCSHVVEHVPDLIAFLNECHRIMKKGAVMTIHAPYYSSIRCWQDPTHVRAISEVTFAYFNKAWRESQGLGHYPITTDFEYYYGLAWHPDFVNRNEAFKQFALAHYINAVTDIQATLKKR